MDWNRANTTTETGQGIAALNLKRHQWELEPTSNSSNFHFLGKDPELKQSNKKLFFVFVFFLF